MNWTLIATILTGANGIVAGVFPEGSKWGPIITATIGLLATVAAKLAPAGAALKPTPNLRVEDGGAALGKAAGEAAAKAGRGPFALLLAVSLLALVACQTAEICSHNGKISRPNAYRIQAEPPVPHVLFSPAVTERHGALDFDRCALQDAYIHDPQLGVDLGPGEWFLNGTGDWSNGLTGYVQPVFVGPWTVFDPATETFVSGPVATAVER